MGKDCFSRRAPRKKLHDLKNREIDHLVDELRLHDDGHVSNLVEERPEGNRRILNDRNRVRRLSQSPAPEKRRDLRSRDFDQLVNLVQELHLDSAQEPTSGPIIGRPRLM